MSNVITCREVKYCWITVTPVRESDTECNRENDEADEAEVQSCDVSNVITRGEVKYCWITVTSERESYITTCYVS